MDRFNDIVTEIQNRTGRALMIVSGGNSSGLAFASKGLMPGCVNSFRVGETIILGRDVYDRSPFENTVQNTVEIGVEIVELMVKPSVPIGTPGQDAFGNVPVFTDKGPRLRAICAIGKQDTDLDNIRPLIKGAQVLGGSSDHLIVDLTQCTREFKTGDVLFFEPSYSALLAASTSPYVEKRLIYQTGKQCEV
jgi:predicted amino acid racemase